MTERRASRPIRRLGDGGGRPPQDVVARLQGRWAADMAVRDAGRALGTADVPSEAVVRRFPARVA